MAGHAVALGLAPNAGVYLLAAVIGGLGTGVLLTAQYNYHLEHVPERDGTIWLSWNLMLGNAALLLGSLAGPGVAQLAGVTLALVLFGALRLVMGLLIWRWG